MPDALIQRTIAEEFKYITVLTIAHRIHTIINYDRIMVLDRGRCVLAHPLASLHVALTRAIRIAEFDSPQTLLANEGSMFYSMVHSSGTTATGKEKTDDTSSDSEED